METFGITVYTKWGGAELWIPWLKWYQQRYVSDKAAIRQFLAVSQYIKENTSER